MDALAGDTAMETNVAAVTVNVVLPATLPEVAVMVVAPALTPVASPLVLTVATVVLLDVHVAEFVRSCWLLSLNVPVAVNCCLFPAAIVGAAGVTAIETSVAGVTVKVVEPFIEPEVAVTVVVPAATLLAKP